MALRFYLLALLGLIKISNQSEPQNNVPKYSTDDYGRISNNDQVTHYDCSDTGVTGMQVFSINEIPQCTLAPSDIELAEAQVTVYQKV